MRATKHPFLFSLSFGLLAACGGSPPLLIIADGGTLPFGNADAGPDAGVRDGGYSPTVIVSGVVRGLDDYLAGQPVAVPNANVTARGVVNVAPDVTGATGGYSMRIPQNGLVTLVAEKTGYVPTYETVPVGGIDIAGANLVIGSTTFVTTMAQTYGVDLVAPFACHAPNPTASQCRYAIVLGRIVDDGTENNDGTTTPLAGVTKEEFTIKGNGDATWYKKGPYFLSSVGVPGAGYTSSQRDRSPVSNRYRGGIYVVFLEIPVEGPAEQDFQITINSAAGGPLTRYFGPVTVKAVREGLAWRIVPQTGQGTPVVPPPPPPPPPPQDIDFDSQIYPIFLPVNLGGYGCQGCHSDQQGAPAGGLNLDGGPETAYQGLDPARYPQRVNVANPSASYLLVRPLYEADGVQDHPIYAFSDTTNTSYQLLYAWIQGGAQRQIVVNPTVSFYTQVRPLLYKSAAEGGAGCYACHVSGVDETNAPGGLYMGGDGNALYYALTGVAPTDDGASGEPYRINKAGYAGRSLLLINPLNGNLEPHPVKLFYGVDDPRYQLIYSWISEGYLNDTP